MDKPFAKTEHKVLTVTITEDGDLLYLKTSEHDIFAEMGEVVTKRASHVEPSEFWLRVAFRLLRIVFGERGRVAEWTRGWRTIWRIDTHPVGGPLLRWKHLLPEGSESIATFSNRQAAINAEIDFLNRWFLERGIQ